MDLDLDDIEAKAKAATPGPWRWNDAHQMVGPPEPTSLELVDLYGAGPLTEPVIIETDSGFYPPKDADAVHIASASPDVVLAMVKRIRELEEGLLGALNIVDRMWHGDPMYKHLRALLAKERTDG